MSLSSSILREMRDNVTFYPAASVDEYGKPTYGAGVMAKARVVQRGRMIQIDHGESIRAEGVVYVAPVNGVLLDIKPGEGVLELPDGTRPRILAIDIYDDENDLEHLRVWYGIRN